MTQDRENFLRENAVAIIADRDAQIERQRYRLHRLELAWEANVARWQEIVANLRESPHYREPPLGRAHRQLTLF